MTTGDNQTHKKKEYEPAFPWANSENFQAFTTVITGGCVFLGCWWYAIGSWGWFLGGSLGWIPAGIFASAAGYLAFRLWWLVLTGVAIFITLIVLGL